MYTFANMNLYSKCKMDTLYYYHPLALKYQNSDSPSIQVPVLPNVCAQLVIIDLKIEK